MNEILVSILRVVNVVLAVLIIIGGALAGLVSQGLPGLIGGLIVGWLLAILINGGLAILLEIERHLREMAEARKPQ
jgi:hypothetical protein